MYLALEGVMENHSRFVYKLCVMFPRILLKNFLFVKTLMGTPLDWKFFTLKSKSHFHSEVRWTIAQIKSCPKFVRRYSLSKCFSPQFFFGDQNINGRRTIWSHRFFLHGFYFYFYSVETPIFEKYSVGCYSVFFNHKKYSVLHYSVLWILKKYSVICTRFLLFDQKVLGWSLLGYLSFCKKYSVKVYSVIAHFLRKYSVKSIPLVKRQKCR